MGAQMNVRGFKQPFRASVCIRASPTRDTHLSLFMSHPHEVRTLPMPSHTPENAPRSLSTALKGMKSYVGTQIRFHGFYDPFRRTNEPMSYHTSRTRAIARREVVPEYKNR